MLTLLAAVLMIASGDVTSNDQAGLDCTDGFEIGSDGFEIGSNGFEIGSNGFEIGSNGFEIGSNGGNGQPCPGPDERDWSVTDGVTW